jgi:HSP20 family protein
MVYPLICLSIKLKTMAYLTVTNKNMDNLFGNWMDNFFSDFNKSEIPVAVPVNVKETESQYNLEVIAPGFEKNDFKISMENDLISISAEKKSDTLTQNEKLLRKEYNFKSFKRTFTIDQTIDAKGIEAAYVNGILKITLPKKAEEKQIIKEITIK